MRDTVEALAAVFQHNETKIGYQSLRDNSFFSNHQIIFHSVFLLQLPHGSNSMHEARFKYRKLRTTVSKAMTGGPSRRGSTAEADLWVIHKRFRNTNKLTCTQESAIPFYSTWDIHDNWINTWDCEDSPAELIAPESAVTVSSTKEETLTKDTEPMKETNMHFKEQRSV